MSLHKLRWGILSTGSIARRFANSLAKSDTGILTAVASRQLETAKTFAREFAPDSGLPKAHGDYASLLENPDVDAVYIATPHPMHLEWVIAAAKAKKQILCEKPVGMNLAELEEMLAAVKVNGVFFMEAFMYRCHPQVQLLREMILSSEIGAIRMIHATFSYARDSYTTSERRIARALGGGSILDVGCYGVSMARLVAGEIAGLRYSEPHSVKGFARLESNEQTDLTAAALLEFDHGLIAMIQSGIHLKGENVVRLEGEKGSISLTCPWAVRHGESFLNVTEYAQGTTRSIETTREDEDLYAYEIDEVGRAVNNGEKESPKMSWDDSRGNSEVLDRWLKDAKVVYQPTTL